MNNKVLVKLILPELDNSYDIYIPINIRIASVIKLLNESLTDISKGEYVPKNNRNLFNVDDGNPYNLNSLVRETNIRNGSEIVLI